MEKKFRPRLAACLVMTFLSFVTCQAWATHHLAALAIEIQPDDIQTGVLEQGDNFYYLVEIPEDGVLRAYTQSSFDTYGELILPDETEVAVADDGAEEGNFLIETMLTPGTYLIRVAGATPFETGSFNIVTEFTGGDDSLYANQEQLSLIITAGSGSAGSTQLTIGSFIEGESTLQKDFTTGETIIISGTVYPDTADVGKAAELFMVLRSNLNTWSYRDLDGNFQPWNISLKSLEPAYTVDSLTESETIELYSGIIEAGDHRIFIGYSLSEGGPLIFNGIAYKINVTE